MLHLRPTTSASARPGGVRNALTVRAPMTGSVRPRSFGWCPSASPLLVRSSPNDASGQLGDTREVRACNVGGVGAWQGRNAETAYAAPLLPPRPRPPPPAGGASPSSVHCSHTTGNAATLKPHRRCPRCWTWSTLCSAARPQRLPTPTPQGAQLAYPSLRCCRLPHSVSLGNFP